MTAADRQDYEANAIFCCGTFFCKFCGVSPYHFGMNCTKAFEMRLNLLCKLCGGQSPDPTKRCCGMPACQAFEKKYCKDKKDCGHYCNGSNKLTEERFSRDVHPECAIYECILRRIFMGSKEEIAEAKKMMAGCVLCKNSLNYLPFVKKYEKYVHIECFIKNGSVLN